MWLLYLFFLNILSSYSVLCDFYDCNEPLFDRAVVKATSSLPDRRPSSAKLLGEQSWTASHSDNSQYLIFDLGQVMKVRSIETQGRPSFEDFVLEYTLSYGSNGYDYADYKTSSGNIQNSLQTWVYCDCNVSEEYFRSLCVCSDKAIEYGARPKTWTPSSNTLGNSLFFHFYDTKVELRSIATQGKPSHPDCVTEYFIQYSDDGESWTNYIDSMGEIQVFKGNTDGSQVHRNVFEVPIIAQWIRINPIRWKNSISMRVELYGCNYVSDHFFFDGSSLIEWNLKELPIVSTRDSVGFRMKTNAANGIILYSRGTQRDYLALQLRDNRLVLNIDLGSGLMTSLSVGSLLDDNIWHDVMFSRVYKDIVFTVDRVSVKGTIKDEYATLNLNNAFYIGGVPNKQEGMIVSQNYTGCIENLSVNGTNFNQMIKEFYYSDNRWGMQTYQKYNVSYICPEQSVIPVTFLTEMAYAKLKGYEGVEYLNVSFSFRTYEEFGLLVYHKFINNGYVKVFLELGKINVELNTAGNPVTKLENYDEKFNDGRWHSLVLEIHTNSLTLNIDQRPAVTNRLLKIVTGLEYYIGGGVYDNKGFIGCMKLITINGNYRAPTDWKSDEEYCCKNQIVFDACQMIDRCNPNPCKHNGLCRQSSEDFFCDCSNTGYGGAMCHTPLSPLSCDAYKLVNSVQQRVDIKIDIDGSGPLEPFPVTCQFHSDGKIVTEIHHRNEEPTIVDGFQEEGSYKQDIVYEATTEQIESLINRSSNCWQSIRYDCQNSKLLNSHPGEGEFRPYAWWVSRYNQKMDFWGGAMPGSRKCECGILGQCDDQTKWCNCDAGHGEWTSDSGNLKGKEYLPVKRLHFGDTGTPVDDKRGKYTLGPLMCEGDDLFNNVITFRKSDATLNLPTFDFGYDGDIYFEFKTTKETGVLVHSKGPEDEILIELREGSSILFMYQAGNKPIHVQGKSSSSLSDNNWHSVYIERNRKGARVVIDGNERKEIREAPGPVLALYLTSYLSIGGNVGAPNKNGFTGCMRAFMLNGRLVDLVGFAKRTIYGISLGCVGKCDSNPCLNNGTCIDGYEDYHCDCRWTSFKGPICADEIGVTLRDDSMVKYDFTGSWRSTIAENIRVGFTTTHPQGFLLGLFSNKSGEYMTITVSNSGYLRVVFDFGFERQELIFPNKHFGLGQYHDVRIRRKNSGATLVMEVDNYEPQEYHFNIKASADAQFNNLEYMYIGKNESMKEGFIGCVSRVEFDDIYPLKFLFQQNGPSNIHAHDVMEDFCGVEPVTHPPEPIETRPPLDLDEDKVKAAYHETASAVIGGLLFLLFLLSILIAILIGRYVARHKGDYLTQEERGCDLASDPDTAVMHSVTGHSLRKKKEWYI